MAKVKRQNFGERRRCLVVVKTTLQVLRAASPQSTCDGGDCLGFRQSVIIQLVHVKENRRIMTGLCLQLKKKHNEKAKRVFF